MRIERRGWRELTPSAVDYQDPSIEVSVVMPCLNEVETLAVCITAAQTAFASSGIAGEVVVADNGSTDGSIELAVSLGVRVVAVEARGYGCALTGGIRAARGEYVVMGDADASYAFGEVPNSYYNLPAADTEIRWWPAAR